MATISVVLPVYNVAAWIEDCVKSILRQTYRDFELIVVDDCGADDSIARAHRILDAQTEIPIQWLTHDHNRGLSAARNTGTAASRSRYVFYLDSDDTITPDALQLLYDTAERTQAEVVMGNIEVQGNGTWITKLHNDEPLEIKGQPEVLHAYLSNQFYMMAWNKLCRRDFLTKWKMDFVEGLIHEDNPWSFRMACFAQHIVLLPQKTYIYLVRAGSIQTDQNYARHWEAYCRIIQKIADTAVEATAQGEYNLLKDNVFRHWFERQKAFFFNTALTYGDRTQQRTIYKLIRQCLPLPKATKVFVHYSMPFPVAYPVYRRMHRHLLC